MRSGAMSSMHCSTWPRPASASCARCRPRRSVSDLPRALSAGLASRVVLASANAGKQREFAELLGALGIELILQSTLGIASIAETGSTYEANALLKARHAADLSGLPALADDSGLEVDGLRGAPGGPSVRYA